MGKAAHQGCRHLCVIQYVDPLRELQIRIKDHNISRLLVALRQIIKHQLTANAVIRYISELIEYQYRSIVQLLDEFFISTALFLAVQLIDEPGSAEEFHRNALTACLHAYADRKHRFAGACPTVHDCLHKH